MGVNGLTSFVNSIRHSLTSTEQRTSASSKGIFVIDAWSFIYWVYGLREQAGEKWFEGGDYPAYESSVRDIIDSWIAVKLQLIFVFDGPTPHSKYATLKNRMESLILGNNSFMRASASLRSSASFQRETRIIPPLVYHLTVAILDSYRPDYLPLAFTGLENAVAADVSVQFAGREADPQVALLAENLRGYAVGQDSDYYILCGRGSGCLYVPFSEILWLKQDMPASDDSPAVEKDEDDGFTPVGKKGKHQKSQSSHRVPNGDASSSSPYPPARLEASDKADATISTLRFTTYSAIKLAAHLNLPASLLPLFAALLGNDHSTFGSHFFRGLKSSSEKIYETARVLQEEWTNYIRRKNRPASQSGASSTATSRAGSGTSTPIRPRSRQQLSSFTSQTEIIVDPVRYIVEQSVAKLISRAEARTNSFDNTIVQTDVTEAVIESVCTCSKALIQNSHEAETDAFFREDFPSSSDHDILSGYLEKYRRGKFQPALISAMTRRHVWPLVFLENPAHQATQIAYCQHLREYTYCILFSAYKLSWAKTEQDRQLEAARQLQLEASKEAEEAFLDEVVSVATESENSDSEDAMSVQDLSSSLTMADEKPEPFVWEEVRRGDRLSCEPVAIPSMSDMATSLGREEVSPADLSASDLDFRKSVLFGALSSDVSAVRELEFDAGMLIACLRHVVVTAARQNPDRRATMWLRPTEVYSLVNLYTSMSAPSSTARAEPIEPLPTDEVRLRAMHLCSAIQLVAESALQLQSALRLESAAPVDLIGRLGCATYGALIASTSAESTTETAENLVKDIQENLFTGNTRSERKERKKLRKVQS